MGGMIAAGFWKLDGMNRRWVVTTDRSKLASVSSDATFRAALEKREGNPSHPYLTCAFG